MGISSPLVERGRALPEGADRGGEYQAVINRTYPLEDVVEATRYVETGQKTATSYSRSLPEEKAGLSGLLFQVEMW